MDSIVSYGIVYPIYRYSVVQSSLIVVSYNIKKN